MADYWDKHHSEVSADDLSRKWGIGLEKAKETLDVTMYMNVRSAILPLTKRYCNDILYQKRRRSSVKFYTDTLFDDEISAWGNKCAQIYADRYRFLHVFPMSSKAGAVDSLGNLVKDICIMN